MGLRWVAERERHGSGYGRDESRDIDLLVAYRTPITRDNRRDKKAAEISLGLLRSQIQGSATAPQEKA